MQTRARSVQIAVNGGAIPTLVLEPDDSAQSPALVVVPSIFGPAPDLITLLEPLSAHAVVAVPDPFWRVGGGVVAYHEHARAAERLQNFEPQKCIADLGAVLDWTRERGNDRIVGLGICFGGPFVLRFAGQGRIDGAVTWHGSRMENFLDRATDTTCPLRLHFGADDPVTPPESIEKIRTAFAANNDLSIVIHPGAIHGYSRNDAAHHAGACQAGLDVTRDLLKSLATAER